MEVSNRNQSLDVLRCIAILLVLVWHFGYPAWWTQPGWSGVDLFFVLSGYLISGLLFGEYQKTGQISVKRFWIRRAFKIYPAFYAMLLFVVFFHILTDRVTWNVLSDVFFLQDYIPALANWGWSLGVEEKFYFVLPLVLICAKRLRFVPWAYLGLFVGCMALRTIATLNFSELSAIHLPAHMRIDSLFLGVALGYYKHFRPRDFQRLGSKPIWIVGLALLGVLFVWPIDSPQMSTFGFSAVALGYGLILLWAINHTWPNWSVLRGMAWVGRYSYSIYLWHIIVRTVLHLDYRATHHLYWLPAYIAASIAIGALAAKAIETPFLSLRDRFYPSGAAKAPQMGLDVSARAT